jgi:predicted MFS family arabinose efflux permease
MSRRVELLLFTAGWGANHFATLLIVYRRDLGLSPAALGILFGAYALGLVPGLTLAGRASDGRGRRATVLPASLLAVAASLLLAFGGGGFAVLLPGRLLYGLAMGSIMSPGSVWVQELSDAQHGARRATLALSAGFGLGPLVTGVIAELAPAPMVLPYLAHALVMAVAIAGARAVPETAGPARARPHQPSPARGVGRHEVALLLELLPMAPWVFGFAAVTIAIVPGILRPHVAHPVIYSALVIMTTLTSGVAVQPLTKRLAGRGDLVGLAIGAAGVLLAAQAAAAAAPALAFAVAVLVGAGYGLSMTTGLIEVSQRVPREVRGATVGIYYVLTYVGFTLPFIHAVAARHVGDAAALRIAAAVAGACLVLRALSKRR